MKPGSTTTQEGLRTHLNFGLIRSAILVKGVGKFTLVWRTPVVRIHPKLASAWGFSGYGSMEAPGLLLQGLIRLVARLSEAH